MASPLRIPPASVRCAARLRRRTLLVKDLGAGATVAIVALPLAMAFAIASGLKPEAGLWTAIIAGFLIAALGGSHVQIGGPAGAFIVIVYGILERFGPANLLIATACAGVLLFLLGFFRLGTLVRFVPITIVLGFTNGIAVLIAASQIKDALRQLHRTVRTRDGRLVLRDLQEQPLSLLGRSGFARELGAGAIQTGDAPAAPETRRAAT